MKGLVGSENNFNGNIFNIIFISKMVSVEMACLLGIQNEIRAVCHVLPGKSLDLKY